MGLEALCEKHGIPESHGLAHARRVLAHAEKALEKAAAPVAPPLARAIRLAALLHDADDKKYFPGTVPGETPNAKGIMEAAGAEPGVVADALRMIGLVSCSKNGNSVPSDVAGRPEYLWPRWADRLEATGEEGVVRCWQYNTEVGAPLAAAETPRPATEAEVWALATAERFAQYQKSGGSSRSMMDHYYDKLLRVARPDYSSVRNEYLESEMDQRAAPLVEICLAYGKTGEVPTDRILEMAARM
uniref:HD/PDEase domain-containing protein n=1 Tax=Zooxanthella nutricula TaxID=1333877 RepID=A0A7S2PSI1_9DINO